MAGRRSAAEWTLGCQEHRCAKFSTEAASVDLDKVGLSSLDTLYWRCWTRVVETSSLDSTIFVTSSVIRPVPQVRKFSPPRPMFHDFWRKHNKEFEVQRLASASTCAISKKAYMKAA
ncbi:argonaute-like protein [Moniliophthora roreri]|nr:argonaute-like protein [Moniliophthora roreri]